MQDSALVFLGLSFACGAMSTHTLQVATLAVRAEHCVQALRRGLASSQGQEREQGMDLLKALKSCSLLQNNLIYSDQN